MKNRLWELVKGELNRLSKYGVFSMSIIVAFIWGVVLFLVSDNLLGALLPMILLLDATMMSVMYIGAEMHFEKSESTISTMLVTPVTNAELVVSKTIANVIHNFISSGLIIAVFFIAGELDFVANLGMNLFFLFLGVILATATFTIGGLVLSYYQKDFTGMLVNMFIGGIALMLPAILLIFGVIHGEFWENAMLINPMTAAAELVNAGFSGYEFTFRYFISLAYIILGGTGLYLFVAVPQFQNYAVKQSGV